MITSSPHRCLPLLAVAASLALPLSAPAQTMQFVYSQFPKEPLPMIQRSVLPDPDGKMGEVAFDPKTRNYYFAAPRSGMVQVMDPAAANTIQTVKDLNEPQGLALVADQRKLVVTCGSGAVLIYKIQDGVPAGADPAKDPAIPAGLLALEKSVKFSGEADPIRYDPKSKKAYFGHGKYLDWIDPADGAKAPKSLELPASGKGIAIEQGGPRIFVTIPSENKIVVVDRDKWVIESTWDLKNATPYPVSLDEEGGRLFVGSRNPASLVILDAKTGKEQERFDIGDDAQDCWWDAIGKRVYVSAGGGEGRISMIWLKDGKFQLEHSITTAPGCRTSVLISEPGNRKFIAVAPRLGGSPTFVYIYIIPGPFEHHEPQPEHH